MVLSKISELGGSVCVDASDESFVTLIADGTSKAGWFVGSTTAGVTAGTDIGSVENFVGIQVERYDTDLDTAPTSTKTVRVVRPKSGHRYRAFIDDMNASGPGIPASFGATAGSLKPATAIGGAAIEVVAVTGKGYTDGDTVGEIQWL